MLKPDIQTFESAFKNVVHSYRNGLLLMKANVINESQTLRKTGASFHIRKTFLDKIKWIDFKDNELKNMPTPPIQELVDDDILALLSSNIQPTSDEIEKCILKKVKNFDIIII